MKHFLPFLFYTLTLQAADSFVAKPLTLQVGDPQLIHPDAVFPYLWTLRDGTALLQVATGSRTYRRAPDFEYKQQNPAYLVSRDGLKTWQPWEAAAGVKELPWLEGAVLQLNDSSVLMFEYIANKIGEGQYQNLLWRSSQGWKSLTGPEPVRVSVPQYEREGDSDLGTPFKAIPWHRSVVELPNGHLIAAIYGRFQGDNTPTDYQPSMKKFRSFTVISRDKWAVS